MSGVGTVNLLGDAQRQIRIEEMNPQKLMSFGLGVDQVINHAQS